ncbi:MAG: hypothetical protein OXL68_15660 [Paracoccaceae bacterium]|nr:hypothetical protein [Paracoccaceae bacterium]
MAKGQGFGCNKLPEALLIQIRRQGLEPAPDVLDNIHAASKSNFDSRGNPSPIKRFACFATSPKVTDDQMSGLSIRRTGIHGEWNYTFTPRT